MPTHNMGIIIRTLTKTNINTNIKHLFIINETVNQATISLHGGDHRQSSFIKGIINIIALSPI